MNLFGTPVISWRGVPLVPCDKLEMKSRYQSNQWLGTTSILLLRVGETDQGVVGLHRWACARKMQPVGALLYGNGVCWSGAYLLSLYFYTAVLTDDALGVLENVEVSYCRSSPERGAAGTRSRVSRMRWMLEDRMCASRIW